MNLIWEKTREIFFSKLEPGRDLSICWKTDKLYRTVLRLLSVGFLRDKY